MVRCRVRHDRRVDKRRVGDVGAGHGNRNRHDLSASLHGIHTRIFCGSIPFTSGLLPPQPYHYIHLSRPTARDRSIQDGGMVLHAVQDDESRRKFLCGMCHSATLCARTDRDAVCRYRCVHGGADMAVHPQRRHKDIGMDGHSAHCMPLDIGSTDIGRSGRCTRYGRRGGRTGRGSITDEPYVCIRRLDVHTKLLETVPERHIYRHCNDWTRSGYDAEESDMQDSA